MIEAGEQPPMSGTDLIERIEDLQVNSAHGKIPRLSHNHGAELVLTKRLATGHLPAETARTSTSFTIFEGTSEIQRMIIGRAVTLKGP